MPWRAPRPCLEFRCPRFAVRLGRCESHAAAKEAAYQQARSQDWTRQVYQTAAYRQLRRELLAGTPACVDCGTTDRIQLDHLVPIRENARLALVRANLAPRCHTCHVRRTKRGNTP